jgi:hypothetical protein
MPSDVSTAATAEENRPDRVKLVYNAQMDSPAGVVLDYLLNNTHFTSRQGRQKAIDAISAFYRPFAEEGKGNLVETELQEVARHCVEVLVKQIDLLCTHFQIEHPMPSQASSVPSEALTRLEGVLADGLQAIAQAIQPGAVLSAESPELSPASHPIAPQPDSNFEQGVMMDGNELGELGLLLEDEASFSEMAA